jgi:hypothetical protein
VTEARIITALPAVCVAGAVLVLAVLLLAEARRLRRAARTAERAARPHSVHAATAAQDAAALMTARLHEEQHRP